MTMEILPLPVFGVLLVLSLTLSESVNHRLGDINEGSFLLSSIGVLYHKKGDTTYKLVNESTLITRNFDFHISKGLAVFQPNITTIASVPLQSNQSPYTTAIKVDTYFNEKVTDFAVDWVHDRVVYCYSVAGFQAESRITVASAGLGEGDTKVLQATNSTDINNLAVDPFAGKIFWISELHSISSCSLDGSNYTTVLKSIDVVTKLTLDLSIRRVFFIETANSPDSGNYSLNSMDYEGGQLERYLYFFDRTTGNTRRDIRSMDSVQERLLLFSALFDRTTGKQESFVMQALSDGIVEEEQVMLVDDEDLTAHPILDARLVHPELQPPSDPTALKNSGS